MKSGTEFSEQGSWVLAVGNPVLEKRMSLSLFVSFIIASPDPDYRSPDYRFLGVREPFPVGKGRRLLVSLGEPHYLI